MSMQTQEDITNSTNTTNNNGDSDLPSSLPSYMPPSSITTSVGSSYGYNLFSQSIVKSNIDITQHQWKQSGPNDADFRYMNITTTNNNNRTMNTTNNNSTSTSTTTTTKDSRHNEAQSIPSDGMRGMTFQERRTHTSGSHISAAQFAASTGGLAMDTALLARVSGTDPSLMGSEEIQQIMRTPDLLSIYQKLQEEDDRRQRRLERNRASARVRREKKKGMVETYEGEVAKLESSLNMLKNHEFGTGNAQELATALQNSSGEYLRHALMSKDAKMELMARILGQHSRNTEAIRRANAENQALIAVASDNSKLFLSLRAQLGLTNEQCQRIANFNASASEEARKLDVIRKCFSALRAHDWLYVPGIETILHQTRNTMTPHQFQKLLSWSVENRPSIDQLQFVSTPSVCEQDLTFIFSED